MTRVDPDDDEIRRYVVRRYAYDSQRRERRHQVIAAFDNKREFSKFFKQVSDELRRRRASGENAEASEYYSGIVLEPGHRRLQQNGRILARAMKHGVSSGAILDHLELPPDVAVFRSRRSRDERDL